ncbi:MAG: hypothetical protein KDB07_08390, partial [Planctomycetes bacterium]|nr:hypothetical protein [Planctomycetota bacterium]
MVVLATSLLALPDVGLGTPRSALAYATTTPSQLQNLIGFEGLQPLFHENLAEDLRREELRLEALEEVLAGLDRSNDSLRQKYLDVHAATKRRFEKFKAMSLLTDELKQATGKASRLDICLVDLTTGGPKLFFDYTLATGAELNLHPEGIDEVAVHEVRDYFGISVHRYRLRTIDFPITLFTHNNHFYLAAFDDVAQDLCRGLAKPLNDGESLAENSRFAQWYEARAKTHSSAWFNAHEWRRLIEAVDGVFDPHLQAVFKRLNQEMEIRLWDSLVVNAKEASESLLLEVVVNTRREIALLGKLQANEDASSPILPAATHHQLLYNFNHFSEAWTASRTLIDDLVTVATSDLSLDKSESDEAPATKESTHKPTDEILNALEQGLESIGLTQSDFLSWCSGQGRIGLIEASYNQLGAREIPQQLVAAFALADPTSLKDAIESAVKKALADDPDSAQSEENESRQRIRIRNTWIEITETHFALVHTAEDLEASSALLDQFKWSAVSSGANSLELSLDLGTFFGRRAALFNAAELTLDRANTARTPGPRYSNSKVHATLSFTPQSMRAQIELKNLKAKQLRRLIDGTSTLDARLEFSREALRAAHEDLLGFDVMPNSLEEAIEAGLRREYFVSPFDSRFQGSIGGEGFPLFRGKLDRLSSPISAEALKRNLDAGLLSFALAPNRQRKLSAFGGRILIYQVAPDTYGGRLVLYGNGHIGWIHESSWPEAEKLMLADKQIPLLSSSFSAASQDTDVKVALNIIKAYQAKVRVAPHTFALHTDPKVGQSYTFTTTNLRDQTKRQQQVAVVQKTTKDRYIIELAFPEGYVLAYEIDTSIKGLGNVV